MLELLPVLQINSTKNTILIILWLDLFRLFHRNGDIMIYFVKAIVEF